MIVLVSEFSRAFALAVHVKLIFRSIGIIEKLGIVDSEYQPWEETQPRTKKA